MDRADIPGLHVILDELAWREERLAKIAEAKVKIEARAKEPSRSEQAEYAAQLAAREARTDAERQVSAWQTADATGATGSTSATDQFTDEESRIMPHPVVV
jgi:peptidoglycan hydrolase CwlO-like protein